MPPHSTAFHEAHGFELHFDDAAVAALATRARSEGVSVEALCDRLFKDYAFGLNLVRRSTGTSSFSIPAPAIEHPDAFLSELVVLACRPHTESPSNTAP